MKKDASYNEMKKEIKELKQEILNYGGIR